MAFIIILQSKNTFKYFHMCNFFASILPFNTYLGYLKSIFKIIQKRKISQIKNNEEKISPKTFIQQTKNMASDLYTYHMLTKTSTENLF